MAMHVALLRAVNLGGSTTVPMAELRRWVESLGFGRVATLLQSGNVVFDPGAATDGDALERRLEERAARSMRRPTEFHVRNRAQWQEIIDRNPFPEAAEDDPAHLLAVVFKTPLDPSRVAALGRAIPGREKVRASGRTLYAVYPDGIGRSKLSPALLDRVLESRGTARNWNTVRRIQEALAAP